MKWKQILHFIAEKDIIEIAISNGQTFTFVYQSPDYPDVEPNFRLHASISTCDVTSEATKGKGSSQRQIHHKQRREVWVKQAYSLENQTCQSQASGETVVISVLRKQEGLKGMITVKLDDRWIPVPYEEVIYLEAHDRKTHVVSTDHIRGIHRMNLKELERELADDTFIRCHRSYIVNMSQIKEIHPDSHATFILVMSNHERIPVSQNYTRAIRHLFGF